MKEKSCGYVHIYCGDGKGKTTAAMGLCMRAAGSGHRVLMYQFMKNNASSEIAMLELMPNITRIRGSEETKFSFQMTPEEIETACQSNNEALLRVTRLAETYDVLFLDEALYTIRAGLLDENLLVSFLESRPKGLEVILTGSVPSERLVNAGDYVTEMVKRKHPFDGGQSARKGIEF